MVNKVYYKRFLTNKNAKVRATINDQWRQAYSPGDTDLNTLHIDVIRVFLLTISVDVGDHMSYDCDATT